MTWNWAVRWSAQITLSGMLLVIDLIDLGPILRADGWRRVSAGGWLVTGLLVLVFVVSVVLAWRDLPAREAPAEDDDDYQGFMRRSRTQRLTLARRHLPRPFPEGWTNATAARGSVAWRFRVGEVLVLTWAEGRNGDFVHVAMSHPGSGKPVQTAQADAILEHFDKVGEFIETDTPPSALTKTCPGVRSWCGLAKDTVAALEKQPAPTRRAARADTPLRGVVRALLPKKLPPGWSPPVAMAEIEDGWTMLVYERVLLLMPFSNGKGLQLMVTIVGEPEDEVCVREALDVLRHIRGVGDFRQVDGVDAHPNGRAFAADIRGAEGVKFKPKELN